MAVRDFNRDLLTRLLEYNKDAEIPSENSSRYLEVLDYKTCKVEVGEE